MRRTISWASLRKAISLLEPSPGSSTRVAICKRSKARHPLRRQVPGLDPALAFLILQRGATMVGAVAYADPLRSTRFSVRSFCQHGMLARLSGFAAGGQSGNLQAPSRMPMEPVSGVAISAASRPARTPEDGRQRELPNHRMNVDTYTVSASYSGFDTLVLRASRSKATRRSTWDRKHYRRSKRSSAALRALALIRVPAGANDRLVHDLGRSHLADDR